MKCSLFGTTALLRRSVRHCCIGLASTASVAPVLVGRFRRTAGGDDGPMGSVRQPMSPESHVFPIPAAFTGKPGQAVSGGAAVRHGFLKCGCAGCFRMERNLP